MIRYDDALPEFAALVKDVLGEEAVLDHLFLRDAAGRLTFVVLGFVAPDTLARLRAGAAKLAPWVDPDNPVAEPQDLFDETLNEPAVGLPEWIDHPPFYGFVRLVERRIVGQDWLRPPQEPISGLPPVVVFASHKGGVGRSTALAISAAALSREGYNVLAIDLDLEAPGLGETLLKVLPSYGTLDFFVESGVSEIDDSFLDNLVVPSQFADRGLLHVAPAVGAEGSIEPSERAR